MLYDSAANPFQSGPFTQGIATAGLPVDYRKVHLVLQGNAYFGDSSVRAFPRFTGYFNFYIEGHLGITKRFTRPNIIFMRAGIEGDGRSAWSAPYYQPGLDEFLQGNRTDYAGYYRLSPYVQVKVKKLYAMAKLEHLNWGWAGQADAFGAADYPIGARMLRVGLRWLFVG